MSKMSNRYTSQTLDTLVQMKKEILENKDKAVAKIVLVNEKYEAIWAEEKAPFVAEVQNFDAELSKINAAIMFKKAFDPIETDVDDMPE